MARSGQALVEYILVIALVGIALALSILLFQRVLGDRLEDVSATVETVLPREDTGGAPGQGGNPPPGQGGTPPGQGGTPPGQGGTPPGRGPGR
jgi:hypothetical protein